MRDNSLQRLTALQKWHGGTEPRRLFPPHHTSICRFCGSALDLKTARKCPKLASWSFPGTLPVRPHALCAQVVWSPTLGRAFHTIKDDVETLHQEETTPGRIWNATFAVKAIDTLMEDWSKQSADFQAGLADYVGYESP